jgi:DNA replication protein DnaC
MNRRVQRLRKASKLPAGKTLATLELHRFSLELQRKVRELVTGRFLDEAINVLAFGLPGTGKTHLACALGHAMVEAGRPVLFTPAYRLVQDLLAAKRELALPKALRKLDAYEAIVLDDIGYIKQRPEEVEVLFTLMAERYERRSLIITSNLVFSEWDQIFQNPMTTAAAIDRLVHHSVILEFDVPSYRTADKLEQPSRSDP